MTDQATRIRGTLPHKVPDARRIVMSTKNPSCVRLKAMVVVGVDPKDIMDQVYQTPVPSEQSLNAMKQGQSFEANLTANGAERIFQSLQEAGVLGQGDLRLRDFTQIDGFNSTDPVKRRRAQNMAAAQTVRDLRALAIGDPAAPNVILQACLPMTFGPGGERVFLRPDVLYARTGAVTYRVGEIKSFASIGYLTDEDDVASAAAQGGVYAVLLEDLMVANGIHGRVEPEVALMLRRPPAMRAITTIQRIERDMAIARRTLAQHQQSLADVVSLLGPGGTLDSQQAIHALPEHFTGACRGFCPLWQVCLEQARSRGRPATLGKSVENLIAGVSDIPRAMALMHGAAPADATEAVVQRRLRAALYELEQIQGAVA